MERHKASLRPFCASYEPGGDFTAVRGPCLHESTERRKSPHAATAAAPSDSEVRPCGDSCGTER